VIESGEHTAHLAKHTHARKDRRTQLAIISTAYVNKYALNR